jgi:hypothetical protein
MTMAVSWCVVNQAASFVVSLFPWIAVKLVTWIAHFGFAVFSTILDMVSSTYFENILHLLREESHLAGETS